MCSNCHQDGGFEAGIEEVKRYISDIKQRKQPFFEKNPAKHLRIQKKAVPLHRNWETNLLNQKKREVNQERMGKYQSGQMGQTVNLLAYAFGGSNPSLPTKIAEVAQLIEH